MTSKWTVNYCFAVTHEEDTYLPNNACAKCELEGFDFPTWKLDILSTFCNHDQDVYLIIKGQVYPTKKLIWINREKSNKNNAENFIKIGCKIRKLWHFKVSLIFHKTVICTTQWYANERVDDVTHSLFLLFLLFELYNISIFTDLTIRTLLDEP